MEKIIVKMISDRVPWHKAFNGEEVEVTLEQGILKPFYRTTPRQTRIIDRATNHYCSFHENDHSYTANLEDCERNNEQLILF